MFENTLIKVYFNAPFLPARAPWFADVQYCKFIIVILKVELLGGILHEMSVWILFELWALNETYIKNTRVRNEVFRALKRAIPPRLFLFF